MKGYGFVYYIKEAFRGMSANRVVNFLAVGTISMALLILCFFLLVFVNLQATMNSLGERLEISVYLKDSIREQEREILLHSLKSEPGVINVVYISKAAALEAFRKELKGQEALLEGLGENPLPDSYEVRIDRQYGDADTLESMAKKFLRLPGVEDVSYEKMGAAALNRMFNLMLYGGIAVSILFGVTVVFIISNSVRMALYSRGQEIELMQWIGATKGFIQGPFLIEGMLIGLLGTALALGILAALFYALPPEAVLLLAGPNGLDFLPPVVVISIISGGGILGLTGAVISVGRFLD